MGKMYNMLQEKFEIDFRKRELSSVLAGQNFIPSSKPSCGVQHNLCKTV